jgi:putative acetyltransferase
MAIELVVLRPIRPADDAIVAGLIRDVMTEHRLTGQGFAIHDVEVSAMSRAYAQPSARYFVVERGGEVVGGGGFARLHGSGAGDATCELRKMYFRPAARGLGIGRALLDLLLAEMAACGYRRCYLETTSWMDRAHRLYLAAGFTEQPGPEGCTGHHGCDRFFARAL